MFFLQVECGERKAVECILEALSYNTCLERLGVGNLATELIPIPLENYSLIDFWGHERMCDHPVVNRNRMLAKERVKSMRRAVHALLSIKQLPKFWDKNMMRLIAKFVMQTRKDRSWEF